MTTLITGANGFIGSHLAELLLSKGHTVRALVRKTSNRRWLKGLNLEYVEGDLFDIEALRKAVKDVDYVYHTAGVVKAKTEAGYFKANTEGVKNVLDAVVESAPKINRVLFVSSETAAGPSPTPTPITEEAEPHPITTYGRSKLAAERICAEYKDRVPVTICRPPAVYGPRDTEVFEYFHTVSRGLQPMVGFRNKHLSLIYVSDLIRGFVLAAESEKSIGKTYFISSRRVYSWKEIGQVTRKSLGSWALPVRIPEWGVYVVSAIAELTAKFSAEPALINLEKARDMVQDNWTCDSAAATRDFDYQQEVSLEDGIRFTIAWARTQGWLK